MTKEQIEAKTKEWCKQNIECDGNCRWCPNERYKDYFIEGANWALSHQWVSVEDELPPQIEGWDRSEKVIVRTKSNYIESSIYDYKYNRWITELSYDKITHWMPIPPMEEGGSDE